MTLLVISPDYASHLLPLVSLATAWRDNGHRVVVASGPATGAIVRDAGFDRIDLPLGRGSNAGVMRADEQPTDESASLRGFFDATKRGMVPTLVYQARERLTDLMWDPVGRARRTLDAVDEAAPDAILVDHLAFSARLALRSADLPYGGGVLGHPTALPVQNEVYGLPPAWPSALHPDVGELAALRTLCEEVSQRFTAQWNAAAAELGSRHDSADAFAEHGERVLYNYPAALAEGDGRMLPPHTFLGSTPRTERVDDDVAAWLGSDEPFAYVSFGSFLSVRADVLVRVVAALRRLGMRAAVATGATPAEQLGPVPDGWLVREYLPQVRLLADAAVAVTHGGNNSVTEALGHGVPLVVLPFSTDQFAGAAAVERTGVGVALDPNTADAASLADALAATVSGLGRATLDAIAAAQRDASGPRIAYEVLTGVSATSARIATGSPDASR